MTDHPAEFARAFRIVYPDGFTLDGAQFPSGRCVVDDETSGLVEAATDIDQLRIRRPGDRIEWADSEARVRTQVAQEIAEAIENNVRGETQDRGVWVTFASKMAYVAGHDKAADIARAYAGLPQLNGESRDAAEPAGHPKEPTDD